MPWKHLGFVLLGNGCHRSGCHKLRYCACQRVTMEADVTAGKPPFRATIAMETIAIGRRCGSMVAIEAVVMVARRNHCHGSMWGWWLVAAVATEAIAMARGNCCQRMVAMETTAIARSCGWLGRLSPWELLPWLGFCPS